MSLFSGLLKCANSFCSQYIREENKGKFTFEGTSVCSPECVHAAQLAKYIDSAKGNLDRNLLMEQIKIHFDQFHQEVAGQYLSDINNMKVEKEKLEWQLLSASGSVPLKTEPEKMVTQNEEKKHPMLLGEITAESVVAMPESSIVPKGNSEIMDSGDNPFDEDIKDVSSSAEARPEVPIEYIIPIRTSFKMKSSTIKLRETIEFAAAIYCVASNKVIGTFQRFVKPSQNPILTEKEKSVFGVSQEQIDGGIDFRKVLEEFDAFLASNKLFEGKTFSLMFTKHSPLARKLVVEAEQKGIELKPYFYEYLNLRNIFVSIYRNKKGLLNLQKIEKRLKKNPIEKVIYHLEDMVDLLNMKYKVRFVNNLDLVENVVKIVSKLKEKFFVFTSKYFFQVKGKSGVSSDKKDKSEEGFEMI